MDGRSLLMESLVWLLPFLCVQRKRGEKREEKRERRKKNVKERNAA